MPDSRRPGRTYYGHGAWAASGRELFVSETITATNKGLVVVLDEFGRHLGEFPTYGSNPHDLHLIDEGRVLVAANSGGKLEGEAPSVTYIDVQSRKLLDRVRPSDAHVNVGHVAVGPRGELVIVSAPREGLPQDARGGVALRHPGAKPVQMPSAPVLPGIVGEALSICIEPDRRLVAVTHPAGNLLTVWRLDQQTLRSSITLESPRGLTHAGDGKHLVVSYGAGNLALFDWDTLSIASRPDLKVTPFSGSHLYQLPLV